MPNNPSHMVPLKNTVPSVNSIKELHLQYQQQLLKTATSAAATSGEARRSGKAQETEGRMDIDDAADEGTEIASSSSSSSSSSNNTGNGSGANQNLAPASQSQSQPPQHTAAISEAIAAALAAAAADSNKMNTRLKEMFKERITSFREAVYLLTGFKVRKKEETCQLNSFNSNPIHTHVKRTLILLSFYAYIL